MFFLTGVTAFSQTDKFASVRDKYFQEKTGNCDWLEMYHWLDNMVIDHQVIMAYKGASQAASAGCVDGVLQKLKYFNQGTNIIDESVEKYPDNFEIRFVRYTVKLNAPSFLGYGDIQGDRDYILENLEDFSDETQEMPIREHVFKFLLLHGDLNKKQTEFVKSIYEHGRKSNSGR